MKQRTIFKALAVAVIILFLGLAIQPSVAQPDIIDFKPKNIDTEELTAKINEKFTTDYNWTYPLLKICLYIISIIAVYLVCVPLEILFVIYLVIVKILSGY